MEIARGFQSSRLLGPCHTKTTTVIVIHDDGSKTVVHTTAVPLKHLVFLLIRESRTLAYFRKTLDGSNSALAIGFYKCRFSVEGDEDSNFFSFQSPAVQ